MVTDTEKRAVLIDTEMNTEYLEKTEFCINTDQIVEPIKEKVEFRKKQLEAAKGKKK